MGSGGLSATLKSDFVEVVFHAKSGVTLILQIPGVICFKGLMVISEEMTGPREVRVQPEREWTECNMLSIIP
jgi:hypothetical protein